MPEAIEAVGRMLAGYPQAGKTANSYIGTIAALLATYPRSIALRCADPVRGVARLTRFLPTVADVVAFCEPQAAEFWDEIRQKRDEAAQLAARAEEEAIERAFTTDDRRRAEFIKHICAAMAAHNMPLPSDPTPRKRKDRKPFRQYTNAELLALYPPAPPQEAAE